MKDEGNDICQDEGNNVIIQDSVSSLYNYSITNTPYTGPLCCLPRYGFLAYSSYTPVYIPLVLTEDTLPNRDNKARLNEVLSNAAFATGLISFMATGSATLQANELFYWDEITETLKRTVKAKGTQDLGFITAKEMSKVGKTFGKAVSWVNVIAVGSQITVGGFDVNTGTDAVVCAIGFIPGVGWVISGVYGITSAIVTSVTGKTPPEHVKNWLFEYYCRFIRSLENWMMNLYNLPFRIN